MKTVLISYATEKFYLSQSVLENSAKKYGVSEVISYTKRNLVNSSFYKKNKKVLDAPRGGGYWLWKPYFIYENLKKLDDGDILFYADSGIEIISDLAPLVKIAKEKDIVLFSNDKHLNCEYTKRDCFSLMNCDNEKYWYTKQIQASIQVYKKSSKSIKFVKEWLDYCCDPLILTDVCATSGREFDCFIDHRHDQSVLSNLAIKYGLEIFRDPSQWGNYSKLKEYRVFGEFLQRTYVKEVFVNSPYGQLVNHHRGRLSGFSWKQKFLSYVYGFG